MFHYKISPVLLPDTSIQLQICSLKQQKQLVQWILHGIYKSNPSKDF